MPKKFPIEAAEDIYDYQFCPNCKKLTEYIDDMTQSLIAVKCQHCKEKFFIMGRGQQKK